MAVCMWHLTILLAVIGLLVSLDLSYIAVVLYCDNLGWKNPENLFEHLSSLTSVFGITKMKRLVMMHILSGAGHIHQCTSRSHNYPLQTYCVWTMGCVFTVILTHSFSIYSVVKKNSISSLKRRLSLYY